MIRSLIISGAMLAMATLASGQALNNPNFTAGLDYWYTANGVDWVVNPQTPGTVNWSSQHSGSACMAVDGGPSSVSLIQATDDDLFSGDSIWCNLWTTDMSAFGGLYLTIGGDSGEFAEIHPDAGYHHFGCTFIRNHPVGSEVRLTLLAYPGTCTSWVVGCNAAIAEEDEGRPTLHPAILRVAPTIASAGTEISFEAPRSANVALTVYDELGQVVRRLMRGQVEPGTYRSNWDGRDDTGRPVSAGTYLIRLRSDADFTDAQRVIVAK